MAFFFSSMMFKLSLAILRSRCKAVSLLSRSVLWESNSPIMHFDLTPTRCHINFRMVNCLTVHWLTETILCHRQWTSQYLTEVVDLMEFWVKTKRCVVKLHHTFIDTFFKILNHSYLVPESTLSTCQAHDHLMTHPKGITW